MERMINPDDVPQGFWRATLRRMDYFSSRHGPIGGSLEQRGWNSSPSHELMKAILEDALRCLLSTKAHSTRQRDLDMSWLMASTVSLFSFENICLELGLSASYVRNNILRRIKAGEVSRRRVRVRTNVHTYMVVEVSRSRPRKTSPWAYMAGAKLPGTKE